jgi:hypothetical protein
VEHNTRPNNEQAANKQFFNFQDFLLMTEARIISKCTPTNARACYQTRSD